MHLTFSLIRSFLHDAGGNVRGSSLPDAAMLIDTVGLEARNTLVDWYTALQLREYRRIFRATDEAGQLDNVARRYAWFKRVLKVYEEEHAEAFLAEWNVGKALAARFSDVTRDDLKSVLVREQARLQVAVLLEALQATMEFEGQISKKFNIQVSSSGVRDRRAPADQALIPAQGVKRNSRCKLVGRSADIRSVRPIPRNLRRCARQDTVGHGTGLQADRCHATTILRRGKRCDSGRWGRRRANSALVLHRALLLLSTDSRAVCEA